MWYSRDWGNVPPMIPANPAFDFVIDMHKINKIVTSGSCENNM